MFSNSVASNSWGLLQKGQPPKTAQTITIDRRLFCVFKLTAKQKLNEKKLNISLVNKKKHEHAA